MRESGLLTSPIAITNTYSLGVVRDALAATGLTSDLPVVGETDDRPLNDALAMNVRASHLRSALDAASTGPVAEGNVGGGTGVICHDFKGGIGTSSRVVNLAEQTYTVGVLVQANHGRRERFRVGGFPVGEALGESVVALPTPDEDVSEGSIIIVVATDAPLLPSQCRRVAMRAGFGVARTGGVGEHSSGDLVLAFATGNRGLEAEGGKPSAPATVELRMLRHGHSNELFDAVIDATEEAILNAVLAAKTMSGHRGAMAHGLDGALLLSALRAQSFA